MKLERILFPQDLPKARQLPKSLQGVEVFTHVPPMSGRTKAACAAAFLVGVAAIGLFSASVAGQLNPRFAPVWKGLGPGLTAFSGTAGIVLVGASITPPICSSTENTARKIEIFEYLRQVDLKPQLDVVHRRSKVRETLLNPNSNTGFDRERNLEALPNLAEVVGTSGPNLYLIARSQDSGKSALEFFRTEASMNTRLSDLH